MSKLTELDRPDILVVTYSEVLDIMRENSVESLMRYEFKNPILMTKVWNSLMLEPGIADTPKGRLYNYLTRIGYNGLKPTDFTSSEIRSFWNAPDIIFDRLINLLCPVVLDLIHKKDPDKATCQKIVDKLVEFNECNSILKYIIYYAELIHGYEEAEARELEERNKLEILNSHKVRLSGLPNATVVKSLLILNGYKGSIFNGQKLEKLLWMATGYRLTDIIKDIHKYIKIRDEVVCELTEEFDSVKDVDYDYEHYGLSNSKIYEFYLEECYKLMESTYRLSDTYPGYSLLTLKSSAKVPIKSTKKSKLSEYEILNFLNNFINSEFEWIDVKDYIEQLSKLGVNPRAKDEGEGYSGFLIDQECIPNLIRILSKYELTEFQEIRKVLAGCVDDVINVSKLTDAEIREFDNDVACHMIDRLLEIDEISYDQLMGDMKWLRLVGHIGVSLRKVAKGLYKVQFNTVDFLRVAELIYKSDLGYSIARKVLERLGSTKPFYRDVLTDFNPAIWNLHKCQMRLKYE